LNEQEKAIVRCLLQQVVENLEELVVVTNWTRALSPLEREWLYSFHNLCKAYHKALE
jgi:hypothetical protein